MKTSHLKPNQRVTDLNEWAPGYVMLSIQRRQVGELCG